jgi:hypothetical protein
MGWPSETGSDSEPGFLSRRIPDRMGEQEMFRRETFTGDLPGGDTRMRGLA